MSAIGWSPWKLKFVSIRGLAGRQFNSQLILAALIVILTVATSVIELTGKLSCAPELQHYAFEYVWFASRVVLLTTADGFLDGEGAVVG